ncbi:MAG: glycosyltransferase [Bacteroidota bacterium]
MSILYYILLTLSGLAIFFLVFPFLTVVLSFLSREKIKSKSSIPDFKEHDFGCIITAYKNADIARPLIQSLVSQPYQNFHVYLVADECDISGFDVSHEKLTVLNPNPPLRLKAKSIIHAIEQFVRPHAYIAVFDADNLAHPQFLNEINLYINNGHEVVQGQRTAKNLDTIYACADAIGEFYKNYIERYLTYRLGSSAVISGSGMAVEANLYKAYLNGPEIQQGKDKWKKMLQEDKILQNDLLRKDVKISYAKNAIVYDEKVTSAEQVETQRSRWLYSYFQNLPNSSGLLLKGITRLSWNQFYFGLVTIAPPLFILLFVSMALAVVSLLVAPMLSLALVVALAIFAGNILLTLRLSNAPAPVWKAVWSVPLFVWKQITALFKMGNPNKNFKHSEHTRNFTIDEVLKTTSHELPQKSNHSGS